MTIEMLYKDNSPIGAAHVTNSIGLLVFAAREDDYVAAEQNADYVTAWHDGESSRNFRRAKVHTSSEGRNYIRKNGMIFFLDEIMRV